MCVSLGHSGGQVECNSLQRLVDLLIASQLVDLVLNRAFCHSQGNPGFLPPHHVANLSSSLVI